MAAGLSALVERQTGEVLLRRAPEWLVAFWGIDTADADGVLLLVVVDDRQRVAVADPDDVPLEHPLGGGSVSDEG